MAKGPDSGLAMAVSLAMGGLALVGATVFGLISWYVAQRTGSNWAWLILALGLPLSAFMVRKIFTNPNF